MLEFITNLSPAAIAGLVAGLLAIISAVVAVVKAMKAKNYLLAFENAEVIGTELMKLIDALKGLISPEERAPVMKAFGEKLEKQGLKDAVDAQLAALDLNDKA